MITVPIEVSARHVHLTEEHVKKLFGYSLTVLRPISQSGQYAARETVVLRHEARGMRHEIHRVRVVGPSRNESQVELALSDCRLLGLNNVPLKVSGSLGGTQGITLVGPKGKVILKQGVIVAQRHIHCPTAKAKKLKLKNGQVVRVKVKGKKGIVFENVVIRVREDYVFRMHIDMDEANASGIHSGDRGVVFINKKY